MEPVSLLVGFILAGTLFIAVLYLQERTARRRVLAEVDELLRRARVISTHREQRQ
jgi:hypothetical protein